MFIRDSRRSYRTYSYAELILMTDLCAFRTPVGVTELMLRSLTYSEVPKVPQRLRNVYWYFGYRSTRRYYITFYWYKSTRRYYRTDSLYRGTRRYSRTYAYLTDTRVLVGTTDTRVPVGTTGLILNLPIREYP